MKTITVHYGCIITVCHTTVYGNDRKERMCHANASNGSKWHSELKLQWHTIFRLCNNNNNKRPSIVDVKEKGATINSSSSQLLKMYVIVIASVQFTRTMPIKVKLRAKSDTIWHMFWIDNFFFRFLRKIYCNTFCGWLFLLQVLHGCSLSIGSIFIHGSLLIGSILLSPPTIQFRNFPPLLTGILSCNGNI